MSYSVVIEIEPFAVQGAARLLGDIIVSLKGGAAFTSSSDVKYNDTAEVPLYNNSDLLHNIRKPVSKEHSFNIFNNN